ncbi:MAG: lysoplasmalogenase [Pseudomonadota bacterium]
MRIFEYGLTSEPLGSLLFSAVAAFIYLFMVNSPATMRRTAVKTLSVALLAVMVFLVDGPMLLLAALVACAMGDALLAQDDERMFLAGLLAFLIGHVFYIALFYSSGAMDVVVEQPVRLALGVGLMVFAMLATVRLVPAAGQLGPAVGAYITVIAAMGLSSLLMPGWGVFVGVLIFMASDTALAAGKFLHVQPDGTQPYGHFVWSGYYLAQALITLSVLGLA